MFLLKVKLLKKCILLHIHPKKSTENTRKRGRDHENLKMKRIGGELALSTHVTQLAVLLSRGLQNCRGFHSNAEKLSHN